MYLFAHYKTFSEPNKFFIAETIFSLSLIAVRNASASLGSVDSTVQNADKLKNLTANLQAQLRQNMSLLEDKLRRAREFVAKVKMYIIILTALGGFSKKL